jgi:TRAP-type C4-dicarboxylate transport system permease small subunit
MFKIIKGINNKIDKCMNMLMVVLISAMTILIFAQVIWRYILQEPLSWSEELARYLFSGVTLFGAVLLYRKGGHINMSLLKDFIKVPLVQALIDIVAQVLTLIFLLIVIWYGFPMSFQMLDLDAVSSSMPWLKMGYVFLLLPISAVLSLLAVIEAGISIALRFNAKEADKWA